MNELNFSRRNFLKVSTSAAGGFMLGFHIPTSLASQEMDGGGFEINAFLSIDTDGIVSIVTPQTEMGQGARTSIAMMVAEELDVPWENVRSIWADPHRHVNNDKAYTTTGTGGSRTVAGRHPYLMQAGASARERLRVAAAESWAVALSSVVAKQGKLTSGDNSGTYGEFAEAASKVSLAEEPAIKEYGDWWLVGGEVPRVDVPEKSNGSAIYPMDIDLPGMVFAATASCPVPEGKLVSFDFDAVKNMPGVISAVQLSQVTEAPSFRSMRDGVAVVADSWYLAKNALDAMPVEWDYGRGVNISFASQTAEAEGYLEAGGQLVKKEKGNPGARTGGGVNPDDVPGLLEASQNIVSGRFSRPFEAHATMMPPCAVADVKADRVDIWTFTQDTGRSLGEVADQLGRDTTEVFLHQTYIGGGFGGGYNMWVHREAAEISKAIGRPVKVIWSREDDIAQDSQRPPFWAEYKASLGSDGLPEALLTHVVGEEKNVGFTTRGVANMPYLIPNRRHEFSAVASHIPIGYHRAPGANSNAFAVEQMVDELALAGGWDPLDWRIKMTDGDEPWQRVLLEMKEKSGWTTDLPDGEGMGCAVVESHGSIGGVVANVSVSRRGQIFVDRIQHWTNCGYVLNRQNAAEQVQSAIAYELGASMFGGLDLRDGRIKNVNFDTYTQLRMPDMPPIEVNFALSQDGWWGGMGEPGGPPVSPAVANAIFFATGTRVRETPFIKAEL